MQRRRFLAGVASGGAAALLSGCSEGNYVRRIAVTGSLGSENSQTETPKAWKERGLVLLKHEFYRHGSSAGVRGVVANHANVDIDFVAAYVRFFDRSGTRIGQASDYKSDLSVDKQWQFSAPLLDTDPSTVARYKLVVIDQRSTEADPFQNDSS